MSLDINKFRKIQNGYGVSSRREHDLIQSNLEMERHFEDTYDTEPVLINGEERKLMIVHDTDVNVHERKIKSPHNEPFNLGEYVIWNDQIWIIGKLDIDSKTWCRGYMYLCQYKISWQNSKGKILQRYVYFEDFTKYSNGICPNTTITLTDNQYGIILPIDEDTVNIKRETRFVVDFPNVELPDVYYVANRKTVLNDYNMFDRGGTFILVLTIGRFDASKDKLIVADDGDEVWICDYREVENDNESEISYLLNGGSNIKIGREKKFTASSLINNSSSILTNCNWGITCNGDVDYSVENGVLKLKTIDSSMIGKTITLHLIVNNIEVTYFSVDVINII